MSDQAAEMTPGEVQEAMVVVRQIVEKWPTFRDTFRAMYEQYGECDGQPFTVLRKEDHSTYPEAIDEEVGHLWRIRFEDGHQILAWPEEVEAR